MKNNSFALFALILVQLFYGVTFTFANDVIDGGYIQPFGFILFRVSFAAILSKQHLEIHHDLDGITSEHMLNDYKIGTAITTQSADTLQTLYKIDNKFLLVVDSLGIYNFKSVHPQWVLLRQSPKINLNRLIDSLDPELIIWDGSNYRSYQERWKLTCQAKKIPFHQTSEKGAFLVRY